MLVCHNAKLAKKLITLRNHGGVFSRKNDHYTYPLAGFNYRLSEIQALLGFHQMKSLRKHIHDRRHLAQHYSLRLSKLSQLDIPRDPPFGLHSFQSYVVLLPPKVNRKKVIMNMRRSGIEVTIGTYALHAQLFYRKKYGYKSGMLKNSLSAFQRSLSLPLYSGLSEKQIDYIISNLLISISKC